MAGLIKSLPVFHTEPKWLLLFISYLAELMNHQNWIEGEATLGEDYVSVTLLCLWYLQVPDGQVHFLIIFIVGLNFYQGPYNRPSMLIHMSLSLLPHPNVTTSPVETVLPPLTLPLLFLYIVRVLPPLIR